MRIYLDNCWFDDQSQNNIEEPFDYTKWQREHFADISLEAFNRQAVQHDEELEEAEDIAYIEAHKDDPIVPFDLKDYDV